MASRGGSRTVIGDLVERATAAPPKQLHGVMLAWLSERVGCDSAIFVPTLDRKLRPVERNKGAFIHLHRLYEVDPQRYLPGLRKSRAALGRDRMYVDTDVYSSSERRNLPFYADIIRPQGITSQLVIAIDFHGRRRGTIHLCRHRPVSGIGASLGAARVQPGHRAQPAPRDLPQARRVQPHRARLRARGRPGLAHRNRVRREAPRKWKRPKRDAPCLRPQHVAAGDMREIRLESRQDPRGPSVQRDDGESAQRPGR